MTTNPDPPAKEDRAPPCSIFRSQLVYIKSIHPYIGKEKPPNFTQNFIDDDKFSMQGFMRSRSFPKKIVDEKNGKKKWQPGFAGD
jgi:hypothetical protein